MNLLNLLFIALLLVSQRSMAQAIERATEARLDDIAKHGAHVKPLTWSRPFIFFKKNTVACNKSL